MTVPPGQLRTFLASLLLSVDEPVPVNTLAEQLWPERTPVRARGTLHTYAARLRRLLGPDVIETAPGAGYQIHVECDSVDLYRFRSLVHRAGQAGSAARELAMLRDALRLWRGRPFGDATSTWLDREVTPRLCEEWFAVTERRIDLELAAGPPGMLIAELWELTSRYPTRESLWARLITALHHAGRRAEALEAYRQVRATLSDELGIEPGAQLARLQRTVLLGGTAPAEHGIRRLPHDIATFTGRSAELATLDRLTANGGELVTITGTAGVGKTALAVHWAHRAADRFPHGQFYVDLHGYSPGRPVPPEVAAGTLLRSLGVTMLPPSLDERSSLLRTALAGRRSLIVLDNARDADQVRALLPGTGSLVLVTSRNQLRGLSVRNGAHRISLGRLPQQQAVDLLATAIGADRVATEPEAADRLARLCDHLPLALAIAAERACRTPRLAEVVAALEDERARLDAFDAGDSDPHTCLRTALSWSYRALKPDAATLFRRLASHPGDEIVLNTAAALADLPVARAQETLDQLVMANLVEQRHPHRYQLPELVRLYAASS